MTQEDKELLLKDLCARLPYGVKVSINSYQDGCADWIGRLSCKDLDCFMHDVAYKYIKPYLRTMDSMTEEELKEYRLIQSDIWKPCGTQYYDNWRSIRWLYEHNFNVSLPEHLFIKVTKENNPYNITEE